MPEPTRPPSLPELAATLLRTARSGVLSTISAHHAGWPFGSLAPFARARDGSIVLVLSELAEHTKNLRADPRASLFVQQPDVAPDPQSAPRLSILGRVAVAEGDALTDARARYVARFADAAGYLDKLDFKVYLLSCEHVRLIGGFGRIAWLEGTAIHLNSSADPLVDAVGDICEHMNRDHAEVLSLCCRAFRGREPAKPVMRSVDAFGFDVVDDASGERFRFEFDPPARTPDDVRRMLVAMAKEARTKMGIAR